MFYVGLGLVGFLVAVVVVDAHQANNFDASGGIVWSVTTLIIFLLGGDIVRRRM